MINPNIIMPYKDPEKQKQYFKEYYAKHPEWRRKYSENWRKKHPEQAKEAVKRWREKHPEKMKNYQVNHRRRLKFLVLSHYSHGAPTCSCCGEKIFEFLTIDHVNGKGNEHRKKNSISGGNIYRWLRDNDFPKGFRVLCMNCNLSIGHYGFCPHKHPELSWHPKECPIYEKMPNIAKQFKVRGKD